jgi:hypothetical protein
MSRKAAVGVLLAAMLVAADVAAGSGPIRGKVWGVFVRSQYDGTIDQAHLKRYIKTSRVWCAWQDGKVLVHVRMKNASAEHVTVNWYPRYAIRAGGIHGDGYSSVQSNGFDSGEVRELTTKQDPKGVKDYTRIKWCRPHFQMIESG